MLYNFVTDYLLKLAEYSKQNHKDFNLWLRLQGHEANDLYISGLEGAALSLEQSQTEEYVELVLDWEGRLRLRVERPKQIIDFSLNTVFSFSLLDHQDLQDVQGVSVHPTTHILPYCMITHLNIDFNTLQGSIGLRSVKNGAWGSLEFTPKKKQTTCYPIC